MTLFPHYLSPTRMSTLEITLLIVFIFPMLTHTHTHTPLYHPYLYITIFIIHKFPRSYFLTESDTFRTTCSSNAMKLLGKIMPVPKELSMCLNGCIYFLHKGGPPSYVLHLKILFWSFICFLLNEIMLTMLFGTFFSLNNTV